MYGVAQYRVHLIAGQHRHHLRQDDRDVSGQLLGVLVGLLGGLLLGVFGLVSHFHSICMGQARSISAFSVRTRAPGAASCPLPSTSRRSQRGCEG